MTLGEKQELFSNLLFRLLIKCQIVASSKGATIRLGDLFRDRRVHGEFGVKVGYGNAFSMHKLKLAIDIYMIKDGKIMDWEDYAEIGKWWVKENEYCRWGGDFKSRDAVHFSLTHFNKA